MTIAIATKIAAGTATESIEITEDRNAQTEVAATGTVMTKIDPDVG
jgi:hypothetical protein